MRTPTLFMSRSRLRIYELSDRFSLLLLPFASRYERGGRHTVSFHRRDYLAAPIVIILRCFPRARD